VAEIGSGWGAFAIHIAATTGARVTAINVSPEQLRIAREHADAAGVGGLVEFHELDYRALEGRFDRVVSVGMMEHVGIGQFDAYFSSRLLPIGRGSDPQAIVFVVRFSGRACNAVLEIGPLHPEIAVID
jgi:cyclopropane fatty-acyl-phospholipid synthase-like methyltransferase